MDNEKLLFQLGKMIGLSLGLASMNTIAIVVMTIMSVIAGRSIFEELSFTVWLLMTICSWIIIFIFFKQADVKFISNKDQ
ncbi:hypothetical protein [Enterococcus crotali]|uniref:hypothetical protein n=1 Tax=Enterococcus crotali TaxID=1453587 RepID=UPI000472D553|nr:hypothetical protein [Enterococcus crotali]